MPNIDFNDLNPFLKRFFVNAHLLNEAFDIENTAIPSHGSPDDSGSENNLEENDVSDSTVDEEAILLDPQHIQSDAANVVEKKRKAAEKLYYILKDLEQLLADEEIFTAYAMINWMKIFLASLQDDDPTVQEELRNASDALFQGTSRMEKRATIWDARMMMTYTLLAVIGFTLALPTIPAIAHAMPGVVSALEAQEATLSPDTLSDILLNSVDGIANLSSAYRQWKLGEHKPTMLNLFAGVQTAALTSSGMGISITTIAKHGLKSGQAQQALGLACSLLGVGCAVGMICSMQVEYMEYAKSQKRKVTLIEKFLAEIGLSLDEEAHIRLKEISDPVELLKQCRLLKEEHVLYLENAKINTPNHDQKVETLISGIAIEKAQGNNHLNNARTFLCCGMLMTLLAACTFTSVITAAATPIVIQTAVLLSGLVGQYVAYKYDNVKKLQPFLEEKTSQSIQEKQEEKREAYEKSFGGRLKKMLSTQFHVLQQRFFAAPEKLRVSSEEPIESPLTSSAVVSPVRIISGTGQ